MNRKYLREWLKEHNATVHPYDDGIFIADISDIEQMLDGVFEVCAEICEQVATEQSIGYGNSQAEHGAEQCAFYIRRHCNPELEEKDDGTTKHGDRLITVCDKCLRACCWLGQFYCDDYQTGGTVEKTVSELESLNLENSEYWLTEEP